MNVIVCLDEHNGMMFNNRRQSRDSVVVERILSITKGRVFLNQYSSSLFSCVQSAWQTDFLPIDDSIVITENPFTEATIEDYIFIENIPLSPYQDSISCIIVFRWNRVYPADFIFDLDLNNGEWILQSEEEFTGNSHERITMQTYIKR